MGFRDSLTNNFEIKFYLDFKIIESGMTLSMPAIILKIKLKDFITYSFPINNKVFLKLICKHQIKNFFYFKYFSVISSNKLFKID